MTVLDVLIILWAVVTIGTVIARIVFRMKGHNP
jgi:hypothetical protein